MPNQFDIAFIGNCHDRERQRILQLVQQSFPRSFLGQQRYTEMAATYSASSLVFNRSLLDDVNMRVFEGLCSGSLLLTNALSDNGLPVFFEDGQHLVTYQNDRELLEKARYYLFHAEERERIAEQGRAEVLAHHTYRQRMESLLDFVRRSRVEGGGSRGRKAASEQSIACNKGCGKAGCRCQGNCGCRSQQAANHSQTEAWIDQIEFAIKSFLRPQALAELLRSIQEFVPQAQVTVVDDGTLRDSTDSDSRACRELFARNSRFRLFSLPFDSGVVIGRNHLIEHCTRPYILLLDDDFRFTAHTAIHRLWQRLQQEPDLSGVAGVCWDVIESRRTLRASSGTIERNGWEIVLRTGATRDPVRRLCDYFPQFALLQRTVFERCRWRGGLGAEHYDFCLQLQRADYLVAQDESVSVDHYPTTPALPGYRERRLDYERWQQWLLREWHVDRIVQNGQVIVERDQQNAPAGEPHSPAAGQSVPFVKDPSYFEFDRPDVLALVPPTAQRVLDIGCGGGKLGASIKERQGAHVTGIERNELAVQLARQRLDEVCSTDLTDPELSFPAGSFDCVICADVLEHLRDPQTLLKKVRHWLAPHGSLVISLPNVQNHTVLQSLLSGNWTYEPAGLLDEDHVRFFTRREIEKLQFRAGFELQQLRIAPGAGWEEWQQAGRPLTLTLGPAQVTLPSEQQAAELFAYQYLSVSTPAQRNEFGLTSIVLVTHNQWRLTKACLDSIRLRTDEPFELIVVDNGSTDGTPEFLQASSDVRLIRNAENRGFPAAVNQGIAIARGAQVLLLNNDTLVTTGWLSSLLEAFTVDPQIGLVGPVSNHVSGSQQVAVTYRDLADLDGFAWEWRSQNRRQLQETDRLIGFCLLIKRELIDRIGVLDERFGIGNFEDDDYCRRAREAGYRAVIVRESFVHHYGSVTFRASGIDHAGLLRENQRKYEEKWNQQRTQREPESFQSSVLSVQNESADAVLRPPAFLLSDNGAGELLLQPNTIRLSVCLIVRDNARTIRPCLESIAPWVDEIVVVDTGSLDETPDICRELCARVFHWPWQDSFAAGRNESLRHARGEWIFWMDSDDTIPEHCGRKLRELADGPHPDHVLGYVAQVHCPGEDPTDVTAVDHIKLIRNRSDITFEFRIHEQVLPSIRRAGGQVAWSDLYVVHSGSEHTADVRARKHARDLRLLEMELAERPDHPFVLFNLGMTCADAEQHTRAEKYLRSCLRVSPPQDSHVRKAHALLASVLMRQQRFPAAEEAIKAGLASFPGDKELLFRLGMLQQNSDRCREAIETYEQLLSETRPRQFSSLDLGVTGFKCRHNLALANEACGELDAAAEQWERVTREAPSFGSGWRCLLNLILERGDHQQAERLVEHCAQAIPGTPTLCSLQSRIAEYAGEFEQAIQHAQRATQLEPADPDLQQELCRLLCHHASASSALPALQRLLELVPDNASAWHNLGITHERLHEWNEAIAAFEQSLRFRPNHPDTQRHLARLRGTQQTIQSRPAFQHSEATPIPEPALP